MKQPDLGRKISELRKAKGLTQEELVERCNISVRTLQRIELGEVTPRSYTIRTILAALDYDLGSITEEEGSDAGPKAGKFRTHIRLDVGRGASPEFIKNQLTIAWLAGILYFLLGFFESAAEVYRFKEGTLVFSAPIYVTLKLAVLVAFVLFQRGFVVIGSMFENYLLRILSFVLILGEITTVGYDIVSVFYESVERTFVLQAESFTYGGILIVYGVALMRLQTSVGKIARYAGLFEIIAGCFFLTILLGFVGYFVLMPAELLEIIILFKVIDLTITKRLAEREVAGSPLAG